MKNLACRLRWWLNARVIKKIYQHSAEGIIILNAEAMIIWANPRVTKEMPDIQGKNLNAVIGSEFTWPPITSQPVRRKLSQGVIEYTVTPLDNNHYLVNIRFLDGNNGIIPEMEEIAKQNINQIVHDIKSHVNGIIGFADLSYESLHEDLEEAEKFLKEAIRVAKDMAQSVDSHLLVSKLEKGDASKMILKSTTDLKEVADEAANLILASFSSLYDQGHSVEIINDIPANTNVFVDKTMLKNALVNALKNAVEAEKKVTIEAKINGELVEIKIINPGNIAPENLQRIFHETFSTKGGNGLGTRAIKLITEAHGGKASIACEKDQVTLTLTLPKE